MYDSIVAAIHLLGVVFHFQVELVEPPKSAKIGERVTFPGYEGEPDAVLNPKKKVWETVQVDLNTNAELVACYKDIPFTTSAGICTVSSIQRDRKSVV